MCHLSQSTSSIPIRAPLRWSTVCMHRPETRLLSKAARLACVDAPSPLCAQTHYPHNEAGHAPRLDHPAALPSDQRRGPPRPQDRDSRRRSNPDARSRRPRQQSRSPWPQARPRRQAQARSTRQQASVRCRRPDAAAIAAAAIAPPRTDAAAIAAAAIAPPRADAAAIAAAADADGKEAGFCRRPDAAAIAAAAIARLRAAAAACAAATVADEGGREGGQLELELDFVPRPPWGGAMAGDPQCRLCSLLFSRRILRVRVLLC